MNKSIFFALTMLLIRFTACYSQHDWTLKKKKDGISVYSLKEENSEFNSIKVEAVLKGTVKDLAKVLLDVEGHIEWAFDTKAISLLKKISDDELIYYKQIQSPLTVKNRDLILHLKIMEDKSNQSLRVQSYSEPNYIPEKKDFVRVRKSDEIWKISQVSDDTIEIDYQLQIDPGGTLAPRLVNLFSSQGPYESFEKLRVILLKMLNQP